ncbi:MAG: pyridoxal phosphate-dependent aminotransferase [Candidatus Omnitrophica bacterium]|nr:pyridoxal phosphate-dependent aminotransferase [Candidatus Omnitrophota bacterium]
MTFSKRTDWPKVLNLFSRKAEECRRSGQTPLDLTESNPTRCAFDYLKPKILEGFSNPQSLLYEPDPRGLLAAREAVCRYYAEKGIRIGPDQVFLTASTSEAYTYLFRLLCNPGEPALAPAPSYPLFRYLSELNDIELCEYRLRYNGEAWRVDIPHLERSFKNKTKAVILVNPNNPTGNFIHAHEREAVLSLCRKEEAAVICDEVFHDFAFHSTEEPSIGFAGEERVLSFTLSGVSKIVGLPQAKLSWIVVNGPKALREEAARRLEVLADTYLSVNTPSQRALAGWLERRKEIQGEILERLRTNRRFLSERLEGVEAVRLLGSEGGWYAVLEVKSPCDDEALAIRLLEKRQVLVHPGYLFDFEGGCFLVLSLLPPSEVFREGVERMVWELMDTP